MVFPVKTLRKRDTEEEQKVTEKPEDPGKLRKLETGGSVREQMWQDTNSASLDASRGGLGARVSASDHKHVWIRLSCGPSNPEECPCQAASHGTLFRWSSRLAVGSAQHGLGSPYMEVFLGSLGRRATSNTRALRTFLILEHEFTLSGEQNKGLSSSLEGSVGFWWGRR